MILVGQIWNMNSEYFLVKKHLVLMTRLPAELPGNGFNQSLPQFGSAPFNRITLFWSHLSNFFFADVSLHNQRLPQKYIVWKFLFSKEKTTKTEERADYCQHFIYMKVLQKAVKKIACGFPQLLSQLGEKKMKNWLLAVNLPSNYLHA